jgi:insertion element IS1 protein InsB
MTSNGYGVRDIARVLKISINTVLKVIREQAKQNAEPKLPARLADVEVDELWSFVQKKKHQAWLWYAYSPRLQKVISFVIGRWTDRSC